jgi:hypothetical protein
MTTLSLLFQLLPAFSHAPLQRPASGFDRLPDAAARSAPAPQLPRAWVDWSAIREQGAQQDTGRTRKRAKAIEYSSFYHKRLTLHRWLGFAMLPLFAGSFITGDQILRKGDAAPSWARSLHGPFAAGTAVVFGVNTITGVWNLWESRKDPAGRAKRYVHSILFMAAGAGFVYAASKVEKDSPAGSDNNDAHRNIALASMGISISSWELMLFFK